MRAKRRQIRHAHPRSLIRVFVLRVKKLLAIQNAPDEDSDQTARMRRLIWIFTGRPCPKACVSDAEAQVITCPSSMKYFRNFSLCSTILSYRSLRLPGNFLIPGIAVNIVWFLTVPSSFPASINPIRLVTWGSLSSSSLPDNWKKNHMIFFLISDPPLPHDSVSLLCNVEHPEPDHHDLALGLSEFWIHEVSLFLWLCLKHGVFQ